MAWTKALEVTKAARVVLYSLDDPELDREASDVARYDEHGDDSALVWRGEPTALHCLPVSASEMTAIRMDARRRWPADDDGSALCRGQWVMLECFRVGCRRVTCGGESATGLDIVAAVPEHVRLEIGSRIYSLSTSPARPFGAPSPRSSGAGG